MLLPSNSSSKTGMPPVDNNPGRKAFPVESAPAKARGHPADVDASQLHGSLRRRLPGRRHGTRCKRATLNARREDRAEKQQVRDAQMGRARLRRGAMLERLQERLSQGDPSGEDQGIQPRLTAKQLRVLREYQSGELRKQANKLTMISGHGRLKRRTTPSWTSVEALEAS